MKNETRVVVVESGLLFLRLAHALFERGSRVDVVTAAGLEVSLADPIPAVVVCRQTELDTVVAIAEGVETYVRVVTVLQPGMDLPKAGRGLVQAALPPDCSLPVLLGQVTALAAWGPIEGGIDSALQTPQRVASALDAPVSTSLLETQSDHHSVSSYSSLPPRQESRVSLSPGRQSAQSGRYVVRTRERAQAALVAQVLEDAGHCVLAAVGELDERRWLELREFEPQAIVVEESVGVSDAARWFTQLRADPFLGRAPNVSFSCDGLGEVDRPSIRTLLPRLERIAAWEVELYDGLVAGCEVELALEQLGIGPLLRVAAASGGDVRLYMACDGQLLRWAVRSGGMTAALLDGDSRARLSPTEALQWVVEHPTAKVLARTVESLTVPVRRRVDDLLREAYVRCRVADVVREQCAPTSYFPPALRPGAGPEAQSREAQ